MLQPKKQRGIRSHAWFAFCITALHACAHRITVSQLAVMFAWRMQSAKKLEAEGVTPDSLFIGDIVEDTRELQRALQGADALVIATSAVPQIKPLSIFKVQPRSPLSPITIQGTGCVIVVCEKSTHWHAVARALLVP